MKPTRLLALFVLFLLISVSAFAGEPTSTPLLRLGTEMHFAQVRRISADAAERFILSCSTDKTAKLWDAENGALLQTFRVPAGEGDEGKLFACALSPDGKTAAVGGWTSKRGRNNNIYIFNTASGEILQRLSGLENIVLDLEFHSNATLAASLGRNEGIRIFQQQGSGFVQVAKDTDYPSASYNLAFDPSGRLAVVSDDGAIRLYNQHFKLITKKEAPGGSQPYSLAFSPNGKKLAVGYDDSATIDVLDGESLELLYRPDIQGVDSENERINKLSFGPDGALYGGGSYDKVIDGAWWKLIRKWSDEGKGSYLDFKATGNSIMDLKTLSDGSVIVAGAQPDFGRYSTNGKQIFYKSGETANFTNSQFKYLTVNQDGSEISFKPLGLNAFTFNITSRELKTSSRLFKKYRDTHSGIDITDWEDTTHPKINGRETNFLDRYEVSRSVDIADKGTILVGTSWYLYALDASGKRQWRAIIPGEAFAVNISGDGKIAVATHNGGEICWYHMKDGTLLLSLYIHPDGKRWILWSPEGYYDTSPGADSLVGWHINNGNDKAAGFFPLSRFTSTFYRPDVVANIIQYHDFDTALLYANRDSKKKVVKLDVQQMLPPVVSILSPENGTQISSNKVVIRYRVTRPSGEKVTQVKVFVNGRPLGERKLTVRPKDNAEIGEVSVSVPSKDSTVSIVVENRFSASVPASVHLRWKGQEEFVIKPKLYVLAVGVSQYEDKTLTLEYAAKDARDFSESLKKQKGGLYRDVVVNLLTDEDATKGNILDGLEWILKQTTQKDVAMVFLAGHGVNDDYGTYYYLPQNVNTDKLRRTGVIYADIKDTVSNIAGKALFFLDTCHSGNILGQRRGAEDTTKIINELASAENGVVVFASSTGKQYSLEDSSWGNGAFTKALVEGFSGKAAYRGNKITVNMLDLYLAERVKELTNGRQTPTTAKPNTVSDFPVAVKH